MGQMSVINSKGDSQVTWDKDNVEEVDAARQQYNRLIGKGFSAFAVNDKGETGVRMKAFDPKAERVTLVPPLAGG